MDIRRIMGWIPCQTIHCYAQEPIFIAYAPSNKSAPVRITNGHYQCLDTERLRKRPTAE